VWNELRRYPSVVLLVIIAALFLIANRGAYKGYFGDDEFDNLALTRAIGPGEAITGLLTPRYYENNFRPVGHLFYRALGAAAGLDYPPYIAALHLLHFANILLLWLVLRHLQLPFWASALTLWAFAFHMAVFGIYWRPMYVYDLLCGTFCLLALLFWLYDRWILSLLSFWLAYRSKEIAVMLPVALAAYELLLGKRRWLRLAPFFAISIWFGARGLFLATHLNSAYTMHFQPGDLAKSVLFYSSRVFLAPPVAALFLLLVPVLIALLTRERAIWFGLIAFAALLTPMLLLSERLSGAYLYVPLIGLTIAIGAIAARPRAALAVAAVLLLWIPWDYVDLRRQRREALSQVGDRRAYIATLSDLIHSQPELTSFLYLDGPFLESGALGAIRWLHPGVDILMAREDGPDRGKILEQPELAVLYWNRSAHRLEPAVRTPATPDAAFLDIGSRLPVWQLGDGWFPADGAYRWTRPHATARLLRPANATEFELTVNIGQQYLERIHRSHVEVALNGQKIGAADFDRLGYQTVRWKLGPAPGGPAEVAFDTSPPYPGTDPLGSAICSFGFLPK
jgi:hypothetical protein